MPRRRLRRVTASVSSEGRYSVGNTLLRKSKREIVTWGGDPREGQRLQPGLAISLKHGFKTCQTSFLFFIFLIGTHFWRWRRHLMLRFGWALELASDFYQKRPFSPHLVCRRRWQSPDGTPVNSGSPSWGEAGCFAAHGAEPRAYGRSGSRGKPV